jgi:hypothetical protein
MTVKEFLVSVFGKSAEGIQGIDDQHLGGFSFFQPSFVIDNDGSLFVVCGGDVLISFSNTRNVRGNVYLVRDDSEGQKWEAEQRTRVGVNPTRPKPNAVLRLVFTV